MKGLTMFTPSETKELLSGKLTATMRKVVAKESFSINLEDMSDQKLMAKVLEVLFTPDIDNNIYCDIVDSNGCNTAYFCKANYSHRNNITFTDNALSKTVSFHSRDNYTEISGETLPLLKAFSMAYIAKVLFSE